jgi:hypothetical protein
VLSSRVSHRIPQLLLGVLVLASPGLAPGHEAATSQTGPWPDFGPHWGIATHVELDGISEDLAPALDDVLDVHHVIEDDTPLPFAFDAGHLIWMRDFAPVYVRHPEGVVVWEPLVERAIRRAFRGRATPARPSGVVAAEQPAVAARRLPLVLEGGNLVSTGKWAFLTEAVYDDNARELDLEDEEDRLLKAAGYTIRSAPEVHKLLTEMLALPAERVVVLPRMPGEATGHVDLFVLALGPNMVMVPSIDEEVALSIEAPDALAAAWDARLHLEEVASELFERGVSVVRWPMLPPLELPNVDDEEEDPTSTVFLSPANLVLYDGPAGRHALLPSFSRLGIERRQFANLQRSYEAQWRKALDRLGYDIAAVDAAELAPYLGLIRCVTAPLPLDPTRRGRGGRVASGVRGWAARARHGAVSVGSR